MSSRSTSNRRIRRRRAGAAAAAAAVAVSGFAIATSGAAVAPHGGQRVDMKVLLLANTAADPDATAWEDNLKREGTPYTRINAADAGSLSASTFATGDRALYQAVIAVGANGTVPGGRISTDGTNGFGAAEWASLRSYEQKFGIRQLDVNAFPGPSVGTNGAVAGATGALDGTTATVIAAGKVQFPNLQGTVPFENLSPTVSEIFGTAAAAGGCNAADAGCAATSYTALITGNPAGAGQPSNPFANLPLVGVATMKDGREEMVSTVNGNENQLHTQVLRHAMLSWVTGGVYIGMDRSYLSVDVDDVFLPDAKWDPVNNGTAGDPAAPCPACVPGEVRMTPADVTRTIALQNATGIDLNMLFNAQGIDDEKARLQALLPPPPPGVEPPPVVDALEVSLLANKAQFRWMNHTFTHASLGSPNPEVPTLATIRGEISQNVAYATANALPAFNSAELVTGEHSGIGTGKATQLGGVVGPTANMAAALNAEGVTTVGADNSREAGQRMIGNAYTLPRYPTNVFYNVATFADQLDEYDWLYLDKNAAFVDPPAGGEVGVVGTTTPRRGNCTPPPVGLYDCFTTPVTKAQYVERESTAIVRRMLGNDPRPHYAHQSNLIDDPTNPNPVNKGDGILRQVLTPALANFRLYFNQATAPFLQPTMTELREVLRRQIAWAARPTGSVSAYLQDGKVVLDATTARDVPITGTTFGDVYGGRRSGWRATASGTTTLELDQARSTAAPTVAGTAAVGGLQTATPGTFAGTPTPAATTRQWQRRNPATPSSAAGPWVDIPNTLLSAPFAGGAGTTYSLTPADQGREVRFVETASNVLSTWGMGLSAPRLVPGPIIAPILPETPPAVITTPPQKPTPPPVTVAPTPKAKAKPKPAVFSCVVKRGRKITTVACKIRNTSGKPKTAKIKAVRGKKTVGTASGKVRQSNRIPTLRLKRTVAKYNTRITITVKLANKKTRTLVRTVKI